jgi:hypothetical protein
MPPELTVFRTKYPPKKAKRYMNVGKKIAYTIAP